MIRIFNKVMFFLGVILFILGVCSADSECLIIPIVLTFGGLGIAYLNRGAINEDEFWIWFWKRIQIYHENILEWYLYGNFWIYVRIWFVYRLYKRIVRIAEQWHDFCAKALVKFGLRIWNWISNFNSIFWVQIMQLDITIGLCYYNGR